MVTKITKQKNPTCLESSNKMAIVIAHNPAMYIHEKPSRSIQLKYCKFEIWGTNTANGWVSTVLPDGRACIATRSDTQQNRNEAEMEGYKSTANGVWRALVEHELLHNLVAEYLFDRESVVVKTESGGGVEPLWERYHEEALVLSVQYWLNTNKITNVLRDYISNYRNDLFWRVIDAFRNLELVWEN